MLAAAQHGTVQLTMLTIEDEEKTQWQRMMYCSSIESDTKSSWHGGLPVGVEGRGISQQGLGRGARRKDEYAVASTGLLWHSQLLVATTRR
jgi:hypothetical protein